MTGGAASLAPACTASATVSVRNRGASVARRARLAMSVSSNWAPASASVNSMRSSG